MSQQNRVPSGKLIDIDDDYSFEELNSLLDGDNDASAATKSFPAKSHKVPSATHSELQFSHPERILKDRFDDDDDATVPTFDVSFSTATFEKSGGTQPTPKAPSRWSQSASVGGTVLNTPAFQSDFQSDYRLWSRVTAAAAKQPRPSAYFSLTSSILNIIGGGSKFDDSSATAAAIVLSQDKVNSKSKSFALDSLLTTKGDQQKLLPSSSTSPLPPPTTTSQPQGKKMNSNSKYRPTEWSMNSLNSNAANDKMDRRTSAYGETQRLVASGDQSGSATRLIVPNNDDEENGYDSADGFGGFHRRSMINGDDEDEENINGGKMGGGGPCSNWSLYKGIFYSSLSSVFFSLSAVIVKYLKNIHPGQLAVCRFVGIFVLTIPLIVYHDLNPFGPPELRHLLVFRGLAGATSLFLRFVAFQNLPIADASVIIFSIPVFVSIFAWIFLKEPCGLFQSFTIIIAMVGLMMTTKLPFLFGGEGMGGIGDAPALMAASPSSAHHLYRSGRHLMAVNFTTASNITTTAAVNHLLAMNASTTTAATTLVNGSKSTVAAAAAAIAGSTTVLTSAQKTMLKAIQTAQKVQKVQKVQAPNLAAATAAAAAASAKMSHFYGVLAALSSLLFASAVFIFIRKAKGAHTAVIMFNFGWVAVIETTVITTMLEGFSLPATPFDWYLIVILGVFSFCGQLLLTRSLQLEQAGPVSVVRATTDIALAFLWQVIVFKETPDRWSVLGALLVSSCILLTSLRKWAMSLPERSRLRERLFFLSL